MTIDSQFKKLNPLPVWQYHEVKLPHLVKLAGRLYSVPSTSAGVERQFSAPVLIFCRCNIHFFHVLDLLFCYLLNELILLYTSLN